MIRWHGKIKFTNPENVSGKWEGVVVDEKEKLTENIAKAKLESLFKQQVRYRDINQVRVRREVVKAERYGE